MHHIFCSFTVVYNPIWSRQACTLAKNTNRKIRGKSKTKTKPHLYKKKRKKDNKNEKKRGQEMF